MTAAQKTPLTDPRYSAHPSVRLTPQQREWINALLLLRGADRVKQVRVDPAETGSCYDIVAYANWGARRDFEYAVWTVHSTGTADIW